MRGEARADQTNRVLACGPRQPLCRKEAMLSWRVCVSRWIFPAQPKGNMDIPSTTQRSPEVPCLRPRSLRQ